MGEPVITPREQHELLMQQKAELLAELKEALRWKTGDWLSTVVIPAAFLVTGVIFADLRSTVLVLLIVFVVVDGAIVIRASRARHRRVKELTARYDMLRAWLRRYE